MPDQLCYRMTLQCSFTHREGDPCCSDARHFAKSFQPDIIHTNWRPKAPNLKAVIRRLQHGPR